MKLFNTLAIIATLALSTTASASWMDGMSKGENAGNAQIDTALTSNAKAVAENKNALNAKGWRTGNGEADGEVDFTMTFKGKGRTNMDTKMAADVEGETTANGLSDFAGSVDSKANTDVHTTTDNQSSAVGQYPDIKNIAIAQ